jgi:hypothetical protein
MTVLGHLETIWASHGAQPLHLELRTHQIRCIACKGTATTPTIMSPRFISRKWPYGKSRECRLGPDGVSTQPYSLFINDVPSDVLLRWGRSR